MSHSYLRVKNWREHQHYKDREPPWIKVHRKLLGDDSFIRLEEWEQWQLVRIWMVATDASRFTLDEKGRSCPVVANDERTLRRAIGALRKVPLAKLIREGWLVPVNEADLLAPCVHGASTGASALLDTEEERETETEKLSSLAPLILASKPSLDSPRQGYGSSPMETISRIQLAVCGDNAQDQLKVLRASRGCAHGDLIAALEACTGSGVKSPLAVALSELKKRRVGRVVPGLSPDTEAA